MGMGVAEWVVLVSITLQFIAAALAVRMITVTGRPVAWTLIAVAVTLMGIRRSMSFAASMSASPATGRPLDLNAESVALLISVCMVLGMYLMKPVFVDAIATRKRADTLQERMTDLAAVMSHSVVQFRSPCDQEEPANDLMILEANPAFTRLVGATRSEVQGSSLTAALALDRSATSALLAHLSGLCAAGGNRGAEMVLPSRGRWLATSFYLLDDGVCIGILRDMTEERARSDTLGALVKERTEELERTNEELRESNEAKSRFFAAMSHELRTPLNSIIGFSGVLLSGVPGDLNGEQQRQMRMVERSGKRLLSLVNDILDLSRIDAHAVAVEFSEVDVFAVCGEVLEYVRPEAERKGLAVHCEMEPDCQPGKLAMLDREKFEQILLNLLSNATKYTDSGAVRLTLECSDEDTVQVVVSDTGCGIEDDFIGRVFDEFERARACDRDRRLQGTGLGLAISRQLARMMGGDITVSSTPGTGSEFTLTLPARPANAIADDA